MTRCAECGHAYFSASRRGHRTGLCIACRLKKKGRLRPARRTARASRDGWVTLHEAARLLTLKVRKLQTAPWLVRLGARKAGRGWQVARTAVEEALKEQRD